jgi:hypothetical protein
MLDRVDLLLGKKGPGTTWRPSAESEAAPLSGLSFDPPSFETWLALHGPSLRRTRHHPTMTFDAWMKANGIDPREVVSDFEEAEAIGGRVFAKANRTKREISELMSLVEKVEHTRNLKEGWLAETSVREQQVPLDLDQEADRAFARAAYKRIIRRGQR